jgi:recA bacterial DNA recombination protein
VQGADPLDIIARYGENKAKAMAVSIARAELETLLRSKKLDTTLTTALPPNLVPADRLAPTGQAGLDRALGGGVPRGQISELVGRRSSGRTATAMAMLADATARGELVAFIDALDRFDPASADAAGVRLDHLLWVRGDGGSNTQLSLDATWEPSRPGGRRETPMRRAVGRALKALALVLSSGGFGVAVLDLADVPERLLAALPFTTWMRLQRMVAGSDTAVVLLADAPLARSSGGASVRMAGRQRSQQERSVASTSFRERVLASRRPFVGALPSTSRLDRSRMPDGVAGVWAGDPVARRFSGLAVEAHVQAGLRTADCTLDLLR